MVVVMVIVVVVKRMSDDMVVFMVTRGRDLCRESTASVVPSDSDCLNATIKSLHAVIAGK